MSPPSSVPCSLGRIWPRLKLYRSLPSRGTGSPRSKRRFWKLLVTCRHASALRDLQPVYLHVGAARVPAHVALLDCQSVAPGDDAFVQFTLDRAVGALHGDRIVFRDQAARRTMGGGLVLDPWPPERGRRRPHPLAALASLAEAEWQRALLRLLSGQPGWVDLTRFALARHSTASR